jgi:hypothetical protein
MQDIQKLCGIIRQRSCENKNAISVLVEKYLLGNAIAVLRQELDSMVRVIYLLSCPANKRQSLAQKTLNGERWNVTDRAMVDFSNQYIGWTKSVYKFGCAFIHLSQFHDYLAENPFAKMEQEEISIIKYHLNQYHDFRLEDDLSLQTLVPYILPVFKKISDNLEYYIKELEKGGSHKPCDI